METRPQQRCKQDQKYKTKTKTKTEASLRPVLHKTAVSDPKTGNGNGKGHPLCKNFRFKTP